MKRATFRSPSHKLIAFFQKSRDRWRARAKARCQEVRRLKIQIRDVAASRDHFRTLYYQRPEPAATATAAPPELPCCRGAKDRGSARRTLSSGTSRRLADGLGNPGPVR